MNSCSWSRALGFPRSFPVILRGPLRFYPSALVQTIWIPCLTITRCHVNPQLFIFGTVGFWSSYFPSRRGIWSCPPSSSSTWAWSAPFRWLCRWLGTVPAIRHLSSCLSSCLWANLSTSLSITSVRFSVLSSHQSRSTSRHSSDRPAF